jgi:CRP-like cAMP-binding protein
MEGERVAATAFAPIALFSGLDDDILELLSQRLIVRISTTGQVIFEEGDAGRAMYVVLEGKVTMFKRSAAGREAHMATAERGDWFGELSLLDVMARAVSARADTTTTLLSICPTDLSAVYRADIKMYALLVMNLARQVSRKLRVAELSLARTLAELPEDVDGA